MAMNSIMAANLCQCFLLRKLVCLNLKQKKKDHILRELESNEVLETRISDIMNSKQKTSTILKRIGNNTVVVFIQPHVIGTDLRCLQYYFPDVFKFTQSRCTFTYTAPKPNPIRLSKEEDDLVVKIMGFVENAKNLKAEAPRILVCGPRNIGKSSLIRFLINRVLSSYKYLHYLESDPGQTEFTPPGVVCLTKVRKPLIGPPFIHLKKRPISMIFTGGPTPTAVDDYARNISKLVEVYEKCDQKETAALFVNTMGWMEGLGLECLKNVMKAVKPNVLIEMVAEDEFSMFDYRQYMPKEYSYFQIVGHSKSAFSYPAKILRELCLLSYFGKSHSKMVGPVHLNEMKSYCVPWDKLAIYLPCKNDQAFRMFEAINNNIVALCHVPETAILVSEFQQFPKSIEDGCENECFGYGIVRAADETARLFHIITPLELHELKEVNALIGGDIHIPEVVIKNQALDLTPIPYTYEVEESDEEEEMDVSMVSMPLPGSPKENHVIGKIRNFRKYTPPRFGKKPR